MDWYVKGIVGLIGIVILVDAIIPMTLAAIPGWVWVAVAIAVVVFLVTKFRGGGRVAMEARHTTTTTAGSPINRRDVPRYCRVVQTPLSRDLFLVL